MGDSEKPVVHPPADDKPEETVDLTTPSMASSGTLKWGDMVDDNSSDHQDDRLGTDGGGNGQPEPPADPPVTVTHVPQIPAETDPRVQV